MATKDREVKLFQYWGGTISSADLPQPKEKWLKHANLFFRIMCQNWMQGWINWTMKAPNGLSSPRLPTHLRQLHTATSDNMFWIRVQEGPVKLIGSSWEDSLFWIVHQSNAKM